jgi:universal stress protein E
MFQRILVAIAEPHEPMSGAVRRARELARHTGARIELFNAIPSPISEGMGHAQAEHFTRLEAAQNSRGLERMANRLRKDGIVVDTRIQTGLPIHEAILRQVQNIRADLLVIQARKHKLLARLLLTQTDFELLRHCPIPLLIVKRRAAWHRPRILAALDPFHAHDKPYALDSEIIDAARRVATMAHGSVHAAHVYRPLDGYMTDPWIGSSALGATAAQENTHTREVRTRFDGALSQYGIAKSKASLVCGDPATELPYLARSIGAQLVVMGAVSRSGFKRVFIGNTAERVLDTLRCDVLIIRAPNRTRAGIKSPRERARAA